MTNYLKLQHSWTFQQCFVWENLYINLQDKTCVQFLILTQNLEYFKIDDICDVISLMILNGELVSL